MNNDQSKLMNPPPPQQRMNPPPPPLQVMNPVQPRIMNQPPLLNQSQTMNHPIMVMNQQQQPQGMLNNNNNQPLMMNPRNYNLNPSLTSEYHNNFSSSKMNRNNNNNNWKGKKIANDKRPPMMRMRNNNSAIPIYNNPGGGGGSGGGGYKPPALNELQSQNRAKTRKFYPKKKQYGANNNNRYVPYAPRNTTSFIIRAKKSGGIAELVSPSPVTPAVLPTPMFSPSREVLGDMAKEEWGVDGYGSMKGLIRLRSDGHELEPYDDDEEEDGDGSSESDVEEHVEVERRLDHDLSRFEMIYPNYGGGSEYNNVLENRVDDQDSHIAQLEEENLTLKERLFLMERELGDLRRRLQYLERRNLVAEDVNEEVVENESESEGDDTGGSDARTSGDTKENRGVAEDVCMQDVTAKETNAGEGKETQHTIGKEQGEKDSKEVSGEQCEEAKPVDESKENGMAIEKVEDAPENDSVGEQGPTI